MATSSAVLARAGLGVLADNDDAPATAGMPLEPGDLPAPADQDHQGDSTGDLDRLLADLKSEVEKPLLTAMVQDLRLVLQKLRLQQPG